jgi:hypothetical protein
MPAISNCYGIHLMSSKISKPHGLKLVDIVNFRRGDSSIIVVNCPLNVLCTVIGLEASDDALVHRLDMGCEIWFKIHDADILKTIGNTMAQEIVL